MKIVFVIALLSLASNALQASQKTIDPTPWVNDDGLPVHYTEFEDKVRVVSLFYTDCPNTCNLTITKYKQLEKVFGDRDIDADFILLSLDPENDTPEVLNEYRAERGLLNPKWHFLTANETQVARLARKLGYEFTRLDDHVFHRMKVFVYNSDNKISDVVRMKTDIDRLNLFTAGK